MFLIILIGLSALIHVNCNYCDETQCPETPKHYDDLGCKAIVEPGECCTSRFQCDNFAERDITKCYFKGKTYNLNETISTALTSSVCFERCICVPGIQNTDPAHFTCASVDCAEWFNPNLRYCIGVRDFKNCCSVGHVCGDDAISKLNKCYVDGIEYHEGQKMYPEKAPCLTCLCAKGFDNTTFVGNKNCAESDCEIELRYVEKVREECVLVYTRGIRCCPFDWKCPHKDDKIIKSNKPPSQNPLMTCKYGDKILQIGDGVTDTNKCIDCKCLVPPMVHCMYHDC